MSFLKIYPYGKHFGSVPILRCKSFTEKSKWTSISETDEVKFLIVILSRGIETVDGFQVVANQIKSTDYINLRDTNDLGIQFEPVAIVEYQGSVRNTGDSAGHYICDIKDRASKKWYRTNDNKTPIPIEIDEVSRFAYVIMYRKIN